MGSGKLVGHALAIVLVVAGLACALAPRSRDWVDGRNARYGPTGLDNCGGYSPSCDDAPTGYVQLRENLAVAGTVAIVGGRVAAAVALALALTWFVKRRALERLTRPALLVLSAVVLSIVVFESQALVAPFAPSERGIGWAPIAELGAVVAMALATIGLRARARAEGTELPDRIVWRMTALALGASSVLVLVALQSAAWLKGVSDGFWVRYGPVGAEVYSNGHWESRTTGLHLPSSLVDLAAPLRVGALLVTSAALVLAALTLVGKPFARGFKMVAFGMLTMVAAVAFYEFKGVTGASPIVEVADAGNTTVAGVRISWAAVIAIGALTCAGVLAALLARMTRRPPPVPIAVARAR